MTRTPTLRPNQVVTIRLERHVIAKLESIKNQTRRSLSELCRIAVDDFLAKHAEREREAIR